QERMTPAGHAEARNHLKLALEIDPYSARAWSLLSLCRYHEGILGWVNRADALKSSLEAAEQAVLCDDGVTTRFVQNCTLRQRPKIADSEFAILLASAV